MTPWYTLWPGKGYHCHWWPHGVCCDQLKVTRDDPMVHVVTSWRLPVMTPWCMLWPAEGYQWWPHGACCDQLKVTSDDPMVHVVTSWRLPGMTPWLAVIEDSTNDIAMSFGISDAERMIHWTPNQSFGRWCVHHLEFTWHYMVLHGMQYPKYIKEVCAQELSYSWFKCKSIRISSFTSTTERIIQTPTRCQCTPDQIHAM